MRPIHFSQNLGIDEDSTFQLKFDISVKILISSMKIVLHIS